jgi:CxxC motif-containing protein (DUF1111 family)
MLFPKPARTWSPTSGSVMTLTLVLAACNGGLIDTPARGGQGGSEDDSGGANGDESDRGDEDGTGRDGDGEGLPELGCEAVAPAQLAQSCGGCHSLDGQSSAYPDLFAYAGSEADFIARVRSGGGGMPAFTEAVIADDVLRAGYAFLQDRGQLPAPSLGGVEPLFEAGDGSLPISFERADGVLVTRGAGRVRQRHELEGTYSPFGPHYFEDRTYGFIVEDYTPTGESRIVVTYLPVARPTDGTNFRAWKIYGDGNVFHANMGMTSDAAMPSLEGSGMAGDYAASVASYARVQTQEVTSNPRENRALARGDVFEFEFGIFIDPGAVRDGSRTAYYTDTFRYRVGVGGLTAENADSSGEAGPTPDAWLGGGTTVPWIYAEPETYFSQMALNIQHENVQRFVEGRRLFHTDFESGAHSEGGNPELAEQAGKLGPLFATRSCVSCHEGNGGGRTLEGALGETSTMAIKLYDAGALGNQLQLQEGTASVASSEEKRVTLADGTEVVLTRPRIVVSASGGDASRFSARIARRLVGAGVLEAIDELALLGRADPGDCNGDGISGRPSYVRDPESGALRIGRFGWKAEKVSVEHQVADALEADLGVTSRVIHGEDGHVELSDEDLLRLTTYMRLIGVPAQRDRADPAVARGELLFRSVGCAGCHAPETLTGESHPFAELRRQRARPYTDLLLHDLGPDLADDSGEAGDREGDARPSASEWRTPPLWGVGLSREVQGYVSLLHDGRAHSVLEAVLWHGGEASAVRERFVKLTTEEREALLRFVESL